MVVLRARTRTVTRPNDAVSGFASVSMLALLTVCQAVKTMLFRDFFVNYDIQHSADTCCAYKCVEKHVCINFMLFRF